MLCDMDPFTDRNVRLALKYGINRQELVDKILFGHGTVGNDQPIASHIVDTPFPNLKLAPADVRLAEVAAQLVSRHYRETILADALEKLEKTEGFHAWNPEREGGRYD